MEKAGLFAAIPIWAVFIATVLLVLLSVEGGYQWARHKHRAEVEKEAPVGAMMAALLGLLAFLLTFTFSMAAERYNDRKLAVLHEANAIRITYLQAGMFTENQRTEIRKILRGYVKERLQWAGVERPGGGLSAKCLLDRLWEQSAAVGVQNRGGADVFLDSVNKVIELHAERLMVRERSQIPSIFWAALYSVVVLSLTTMGYHSGVAGANRSPVSVAVAVAISIVILLIVDLDRPGEGFVNVSQQAMIDVRDWMTGLKH